MESNPIILRLLSDDKVRSLLDNREKAYWLSAIGESLDINSDNVCSLAKLTYLLSTYIIEEDEDSDKMMDLLCRLLKVYPIRQDSYRNEWNALINFSLKDEYLGFYFILSSALLKSGKTISARLSLSDYHSDDTLDENDWEKRVLSSMLKSVLYLIRKQNGFEDIRKAIEEISKLQKEQSDYEAKYLDSFHVNQQTEKALRLVALYHVSKAVVETGNYIIQGYDYPNRRIDAIIRQHIDIAQKLLKTGALNTILQIIAKDLYLLVSNAIWNGTAFNDKLRQLCKLKSEMGLLELLPSQKDAMNKRLFDVAANAIVLQMPTSAGKTLLAEFNIVVTKSLLPQSKIVYIVPSRALVNQVYHDLRTDLGSLGLNVEKTSSVNEVDPAENNFLQADDIDIMVSTPEKIDLLIRRDHPSVKEVSLFIVDEAHMISSGERGARLELLMAILRRERPNAKFLLLSPFLPGDRTAIQEWLGGGNTIEVDWKPSEKLVLGINATKTKATTEFVLSPYAAPYKENYVVERHLDASMNSKGKSLILEYVCRNYVQKGKTLLILCQGRTSANNTAKKIFESLDQPDIIDSDTQIVKKYLEEEIGCSTLFSQLLSKGIAVHHAGLSDETKLLIEHLIRERHLQYVCATTTIAEGVNFPVSSVYFDTLYKGQARKENLLTSNDFWNIAGRAGRTMIDDYGKIILPFNSVTNKENAIGIVQRSAEELVSVLSKLFVERNAIQDILVSNDHALSYLLYQYKDAFAPLFQYFIHLLNISKNEYVEDVEDLFKDSFIYSKLGVVEQSEFIELCSKIYRTIDAKYSSVTGLLSFADKTGFSVPSVLKIMAEKSQSSTISDLDGWIPENLFSRTDPTNLTEKVKVIAALPETGLGTDSDKASFNPELVARMLISWVHGDKLNVISGIHPHFKGEEITQQIADFVQYMNGARFKASWGLSALEGIVKGVESDVQDSYIPSYVYYGVDDNKSLALRMVGIPRSLAKSLSRVITKDISTYSFASLREAIKSLSLNDWDDLKPVHSLLSGEEWRRVVNILMKEK